MIITSNTFGREHTRGAQRSSPVLSPPFSCPRCLGKLPRLASVQKEKRGQGHYRTHRFLRSMARKVLATVRAGGLQKEKKRAVRTAHKAQGCGHLAWTQQKERQVWRNDEVEKRILSEVPQPGFKGHAAAGPEPTPSSQVHRGRQGLTDSPL